MFRGEINTQGLPEVPKLPAPSLLQGWNWLAEHHEQNCLGVSGILTVLKSNSQHRDNSFLDKFGLFYYLEFLQITHYKTFRIFEGFGMLWDGEKSECEEPLGRGAEVWELKTFHGMKILEELGVRRLLGPAVYFASNTGIFFISSPCCFAFSIAALLVFCSWRAQTLHCLLLFLKEFAVPDPLCWRKSQRWQNGWDTKREGSEPQGLQDPVPSQGGVFGRQHLKLADPGDGTCPVGRSLVRPLWFEVTLRFLSWGITRGAHWTWLQRGEMGMKCHFKALSFRIQKCRV